MTTSAIVRELDLEQLVLKSGGHSPDGEFCVMEAVAFVAGETWSDHPQCASPSISAIMRRLNDTMTDDERQRLKPYIPRLVGTAASTAIEDERRYMAIDWSVHVAAVRAFRRIGLIEQAEKLERLAMIVDGRTYRAAIPALRSAADAAYKFRSERRAELEAKLRNLLVGKVSPDAVAAVAAAVAAVAAAAVAAVAAAVAAVAAAAVAAVAAVAAAAADSKFLAGIVEKITGQPYWTVYGIVREAVRGRFDEMLKPYRAEVITSALELVDRLIAVGQLAA